MKTSKQHCTDWEGYDLCIQEYICMHVTTMNEKGHEFGTEQGGVYRRVWGKKKEGEMM